MLTILGFVIVNLLLLASALFLFILFNKESEIKLSKLILGTFTFLFTQLILIEIFLGSFSALNYSNFVIITVLIFTSLAIFMLSDELKFPKIETSDRSYKITLIFGLLLFTPLAIILISRLITAFIEIPMEYDSVAYHLPFIAKWLQTGNLLEPYYSAFSGPIGYYPSNFDLLLLSRVLPFSTDWPTAIVNFPILILLGFAFYSLLKNLEIKSKISLLLTATLLYMPLFISQTGTQLSDLFFTLTFILSIYFLSEEHKKSSFLNIILFGLSLGLFIGTKYLGLIYAGLPLLIFLILNHKKKTIFTLLITLTLTGGFFYIRNLALTGNPIFPAEVKIFGVEIFEGYKQTTELIKNSSLSSTFKEINQVPELAKIFHERGGYQSLLLIFLVTITLFFLSKASKLLWTSTLAAFVYLFLYSKAPYTGLHISQNMRYAMPFFAIAIIVAGLLINQTKKTKPIIITLVLVALIPSMLQIRRHFPDLKNYSWERESNFKKSYTKWYTNDPKIINLMEVIDWLNTNDTGAKIAYSGFNFHYHLFGRQLQREVDYININDCQNCDYSNFKDSKNGIRANPDYDAWLNNLRAKKKQYLIIDSKTVSETKIHELYWAAKSTKNFTLQLHKDNIYLFKIN